MWVSRSEWQRLQQRVLELEHKANNAGYITVYKKMDPLMQWLHQLPPSARISIESAIIGLADRAGLELTYQEGRPETVVIAQKPKK